MEQLQNTLKNQLKSYILSIKQNIQVIILIPTIIGGLLQVCQLANISPILVRFFSITQLISDGLFLIAILIVLFILPVFCAQILDFLLAMYYNKKRFFITSSILAIGLSILSFRSYLFEEDYFDKNVNANFLLFWFVVFLSILSAINLRNAQIKSQRHPNIIFGTLTFLLILTFFVSGIFSGKIFNILNDKIPVDNFEIIQKKFKDNGKVEILYFNDKYIFIKTSCSSATGKIHIEKTEALFE